jgi:hypothetical protein
MPYLLKRGETPAKSMKTHNKNGEEVWIALSTCSYELNTLSELCYLNCQGELLLSPTCGLVMKHYRCCETASLGTQDWTLKLEVFKQSINITYLPFFV